MPCAFIIFLFLKWENKGTRVYNYTYFLQGTNLYWYSKVDQYKRFSILFSENNITETLSYEETIKEYSIKI